MNQQKEEKEDWLWFIERDKREFGNCNKQV